MPTKVNASEAVYTDGKTKARVGDVVVAPGNVRVITIALAGISVKVLGIGTDEKTGNTFVLPQRFVHDYPASECVYLEKQILNLPHLQPISNS